MIFEYKVVLILTLSLSTILYTFKKHIRKIRQEAPLLAPFFVTLTFCLFSKYFFYKLALLFLGFCLNFYLSHVITYQIQKTTVTYLNRILFVLCVMNFVYPQVDRMLLIFLSALLNLLIKALYQDGPLLTIFISHKTCP